MQNIAAFEMKAHFSAFLNMVEYGEEIIVTKHGTPVAKLIPIKQTDDNQESMSEAIEHIKKLSSQNKLNGINWKELRDEGRRY